MSIGPLDIAASVAGTPLSLKKGSAVERLQREVGAQQRKVYHNEKAEAASGVGEPDGENHETAERGSDGRRPLGNTPEREEIEVSRDAPQSKDPSQQSGNLLDLTG